jgi:signal transduction histidine kinase
MRWRLRTQLLLPPLALLLAVLGVSLGTAVAAAARARGDIEARVRDVAQNLLEEPSYPLRENVLRQMKRLSGADYLWVPDAEPPLSTLPDDHPGLPPPGAVGDDWQTLRLGPPVAVGGQSYLCGGIRLAPRPPRAGGTLYILYPEARWRDAVWGAAWPSLALGGAVGLAAVGLTAALGQRLGRRVRELERRTRLIAAGDFSPMPLPSRDDEIRDLTRSVNEMAQRLAQFQETVRKTERLRLLGQVSGGLAHQLRNGLAGARLAVQLYAREQAGRTDTAALDVALRQLTLLEAHLKRFLDLGRDGPSRCERCLLVPLVTEAVELLLPQCRHAGIDLRWEAPAGDPAVVGDAGQLGQLLLNVLGNAVEAAGPGGTASIQMTNDECEMRKGAKGEHGSSFIIHQSSFIILEVWDSGPGPPAAVAERLFEPFVTGKPEGVGLGLAVARQVAEAHGGRIGWRREGGRTCFRVQLPRA